MLNCLHYQAKFSSSYISLTDDYLQFVNSQGLAYQQIIYLKPLLELSLTMLVCCVYLDKNLN